jgi:peptidoglycan/xylan/chitin deacetylase (PgdA/CDA1 family)
VDSWFGRPLGCHQIASSAANNMQRGRSDEINGVQILCLRLWISPPTHSESAAMLIQSRVRQMRSGIACAVACMVVSTAGFAETRSDTAPTAKPAAEAATDTRTSVRLFAAQNLTGNETKPAAAKAKAPNPKAIAKAARCKDRGALGVARTITLDTTERHHYGQQQYRKQDDILQDGEVVLTFDDGPLRRHTQRVLEALEKHCTKATFFVVGRMAIADPDMLRKVADAGHTIAHHSWSHLNQGRYSFERTIAEFELGVSAVEAVTGKPSAPFFRFPYLADPQRMQQYLSQRNFGIFSIDIDSYDWRSKSASRVHSTIMQGLKRRGKGILLFHDIQNATASALDRLLTDIKKSGYRIAHLASANPAETLPEYDKEAAIRLEKRNYRSRSRPLKTAFRFNGAATSSRQRNAAPEAAVARQPRRPAVRQTRVEPTSRPTVQTRAPEPRLRTLPEPRPVQRAATPNWRDSVFGQR